MHTHAYCILLFKKNILARNAINPFSVTVYSVFSAKGYCSLSKLFFIACIGYRFIAGTHRDMINTH